MYNNRLNMNFMWLALCFLLFLNAQNNKLNWSSRYLIPILETDSVMQSACSTLSRWPLPAAPGEVLADNLVRWCSYSDNRSHSAWKKAPCAVCQVNCYAHRYNALHSVMVWFIIGLIELVSYASECFLWHKFLLPLIFADAKPVSLFYKIHQRKRRANFM